MFVDVSHPLNLMIALFDVVLVNAHGIDPDGQRRVGGPEIRKSLVHRFCDGKVAFVY